MGSRLTSLTIQGHATSSVKNMTIRYSIEYFLFDRRRRRSQHCQQKRDRQYGRLTKCSVRLLTNVVRKKTKPLVGCNFHSLLEEPSRHSQSNKAWQRRRQICGIGQCPHATSKTHIIFYVVRFHVGQFNSRLLQWCLPESPKLGLGLGFRVMGQGQGLGIGFRESGLNRFSTTCEQSSKQA